MGLIIITLLLLPLSWSASPTATYPYNVTHGQLNIASLSNTTFTSNYPYTFSTTPQGFVAILIIQVAIAGMEIVSNLLIDFEWNFQHLTSTSFNIVYTSFNSTFTLSKVSLNYLIFIAESYLGAYVSTNIAFGYTKIDELPSNVKTTFADGSAVYTSTSNKLNSRYMNACFVFFRGMKLSANTVSSMYDLNITCTDFKTLEIKFYIGANAKLLKFKASLFIFDRYELQISKNMAFDYGIVEYTNGTTSSLINPSPNYAVIFGLTGFKFQTTLTQFNLANYLTFNLSSPSPPYYRLSYVIFAFLSCPPGTFLNRVTRTCDTPVCSQQSQLFSPQVISGQRLNEMQSYKSTTLFLIYLSRLDIYKYDAMIQSYAFSYRLYFLSSLSSICSYGFTNDYSRLVVADSSQNIAIYAWDGDSYEYQNMIYTDSENTKKVMNIRISDDGLSLFIDYVSTSSIYTFSIFIYNTVTNKYEYTSSYSRSTWNSAMYQSFVTIIKQNKTSIYVTTGTYYEYMKQLSISSLYQSVEKYNIDSTAINQQVKSFCSQDRSLIVTIFINPRRAERYGMAIYQRDPVTLIHRQIQIILFSYSTFASSAIDKQGLAILIPLSANTHFLVYKRASINQTFSLVDIIDGIYSTDYVSIFYPVSLSEVAGVKFTMQGTSIRAYFCPANMPSVTNIPIPASIYVNQANPSSPTIPSSNSSSTPNSTNGLNSSSTNLDRSKSDNNLYVTSIAILSVIVFVLLALVALLTYILIKTKMVNKAVYSDAKNNLSEGRNEKNDITLESIENSVVNVEIDNIRPKKIRKSRAMQLESIHVDSISMIE